MTVYDRLGRILIATFAAASLAGCGSQQMPGAVTVPQNAQRAGRSWMAPNSGSQDLLYVTGACGGICVFSYPRGKLVGEISASDAEGECVDKSGDVFVVSFGTFDKSGEIVEYAHGGTNPIATLSDPGYHPQACSVDPTTGNLAVTNVSALSGGTGTIAIYAGAQGDPVDYVDPKIYYMGFCGYDGKGNLFVDGQYDHQGTFELDVLRNGTTKFQRIKLDRTVTYPYEMQWVGNYLALAESDNAIYHVAISGSKGAVIGSTVLNGPKSIVEVQFWIQKTTIIVPYGKGDSPDRVGYWKYPTGGLPARNIRVPKGELGELFGAVVSAAPHR